MPASASCSSSATQLWTRNCPFGAFHGRFSQTVLASSIRLNAVNSCVVQMIKSRSSWLNCRSPIQNGVSHCDATAYHLDSMVLCIHYIVKIVVFYSARALCLFF